jgi:hypothetical protein
MRDIMMNTISAYLKELIINKRQKTSPDIITMQGRTLLEEVWY